MANIIITNISTLSNDPKLWQYSSDLGMIDGVNTNEAPVKYLIRYIAKNNKKIDKIIAVTTNEAEPALDALKASLKCFPISTPEPFMIKFKENKFAETIREVSNEFNSGDHVFIDTTGGFRNSSYFLMCVVRILEYSGTDLIKAVYSKFEKDNPDNNRIIDVTDLYNMYDLINAVDAFTNYGNSHGLEQYFKDTDEPAVKEVISAMNAFSDMISLCRTSELSGILSKLNSSLDKLSKTDTDKADIILLKTLIPAVREKFYIKNKRIEYPDIVRWCLDNRFIQQAVTIYVERMPEYIFSKNYITISDKMSDKIKTEKANSHFDINYEMFYNYFAGQDNKKSTDKNELQELIRIVLKECPKEYVYNTENKYHILFNRLMYARNTDSILAVIAYDICDKPKLEKELKGFLKLRNTLYDKNGNRRHFYEYMKELSYSPELRDHIKNRPNITAKNVEGFIRSAACDNTLFIILSGIKQDAPVKSQLELIDALSDGYVKEGFSLGEGVSALKMQRILRDILYVKNFIRNKLNHASEDESVNEEKQVYFSSHGYDISSDIDCDKITEFMLNAIENL